MASVGSLSVLLTANTLRFNTGMRGASKHLSRFRGGAKSTIRTLAMLSAGMVSLAGLGMAVRGIIRATAEFQKLDLRLKTVMGSAAKAKKAFSEVFDLFVASPMELAPLMDAKILLESFGVSGKKALERVADAAAIMDRPVRDIALALGSMEREPLRRLGIESVKLADKFTFAFRDRAGKALKTTADGMVEARKEMVRIMGIRFGGGLEELSRTGPGRWSTFTGAVKAGAADIGRATMNHLAPAFGVLNDAIINAMKTGVFKEWGRSFARNVVMPIMLAPKAWNRLVESQRKALKIMLAAGVAFAVAWQAGVIGLMVKSTVAGMIVMVSAWTVLDAKLIASQLKFLAVVKGMAIAWTTLLSGMVIAVGSVQLGRALNDAFDVSSLLTKLYVTGKNMLAFWGTIAKNLGYIMAGVAKDIMRNLKAAVTFGEVDDRMKMTFQAIKDSSARLNAVVEKSIARRDAFMEQNTLMLAGNGAPTFAEAFKRRMSLKGVGETISDTFAAIVPASAQGFVDQLKQLLAKAKLNVPIDSDFDPGDPGMAGGGTPGKLLGYPAAVAKGTMAAYSAELRGSEKGFETLARLTETQVDLAKEGNASLMAIATNAGQPVPALEIPR